MKHVSCDTFHRCASHLMKHVLHSSLFSSLISILNKSLSTEQLNTIYNRFPIHNHLRYTMLYVRSHWITTLFGCENHTSPPVTKFACYVCVHALPRWSFLISAVFLNSSVTFWTRNIVHYLLQQYLTTFFRSPEKLLCVDYCCFHNKPFNFNKFLFTFKYIKKSLHVLIFFSSKLFR